MSKPSNEPLPGAIHTAVFLRLSRKFRCGLLSGIPILVIVAFLSLLAPVASASGETARSLYRKGKRQLKEGDPVACYNLLRRALDYEPSNTKIRSKYEICGKQAASLLLAQVQTATYADLCELLGLLRKVLEYDAANDRAIELMIAAERRVAIERIRAYGGEAREVRLLVEEAYPGKARGGVDQHGPLNDKHKVLNLRAVREVLKRAGLQDAAQPASADLSLRIEYRAEAVGAYWAPFGQTTTMTRSSWKWYYSGARVQGRVCIGGGATEICLKYYASEKDYTDRLFIKRLQEDPSDAPFGIAFLEAGLAEKIVYLLTLAKGSRWASDMNEPTGGWKEPLFTRMINSERDLDYTRSLAYRQEEMEEMLASGRIQLDVSLGEDLCATSREDRVGQPAAQPHASTRNSSGAMRLHCSVKRARYAEEIQLRWDS